MAVCISARPAQHMYTLQRWFRCRKTAIAGEQGQEGERGEPRHDDSGEAGRGYRLGGPLARNPAAGNGSRFVVPPVRVAGSGCDGYRGGCA